MPVSRDCKYARRSSEKRFEIFAPTSREYGRSITRALSDRALSSVIVRLHVGGLAF